MQKVQVETTINGDTGKRAYPGYLFKTIYLIPLATL